MNLNYHEKYLKYKNKYLNLNNQNDGDNKEINSIVVSHNGRIRCLLNMCKDKIGSSEKEIRFMNCCILLFQITKFGLTLNLVYTGELDQNSIDKAIKDKRSYYTTKKFNTTDDKYKSIIKEPFETIKYDLQKLSLDNIGDNTYNFYIIRHGDGVHNSMNTSQKIKSLVTDGDVRDAMLTPSGSEQAVNAGIILNDYLNKADINYLFVSDLKRTRQTIYNMLEKIKSSKKPNKIIILECSHELNYIQNKICDGNQGITSGMSFENKSNCLDTSKKEGCPTKLEENDQITIDWTYYSNFYNGTRMKKATTSKYDVEDADTKCRNTNMIKQAINIINKEKIKKR